MAGRDVGDHLLDQIALAAAIPEMMMRVDDRARGIDDGLGMQRKPVLARIGEEAAVRDGGRTGHGSSLPEFRYCREGSRPGRFFLALSQISTRSLDWDWLLS